MKKQFCTTALFALFSFAANAQSAKFEIGLSGGSHLHNNVSRLRSADDKARFDLMGGFYARYKIRSKWKVGIDIGAESWSFKSPIRYTDMNGNPISEEDLIIRQASPMLSIRATITRVLHAGKWETDLTLKSGYANAIHQEPANSPSAVVAGVQTEYSIPGNGSGITAGLQLEESRMVTNRVGVVALLGVNYYRIKWESFSKEAENLVSFPLQIGIFARF